MRRILPFLILAGLLLAPGLGTVVAEPAPTEPLTVFLVRHAEKQADARDPELTDEGRRRAESLALLLRDAGIEHVHSSDYARTRETARPIAERLGLEVELYDPRDLRGVRDRVLATGGRHLVVGHSNTTPALVELLGGEPGAPIDEATEYDRLYVVTIAGESVQTVLLRYGPH